MKLQVELFHFIKYQKKKIIYKYKDQYLQIKKYSLNCRFCKLFIQIQFNIVPDLILLHFMKSILSKWDQESFAIHIMKYKYVYQKIDAILDSQALRYYKLFAKYTKFFKKFSLTSEIHPYDILKVFREYIMNKQDPQNILNLSFAKMFMSINSNKEYIKMRKILNSIKYKVIPKVFQYDDQYKHMLTANFIIQNNKNKDDNKQCIKDIQQVLKKINQLQENKITLQQLSQQQKQLIKLKEKTQELLQEQQYEQYSVLGFIDQLVQKCRPSIYEHNLQALKINSLKNKKVIDDIIQFVKQDLPKMKVQSINIQQIMQQQSK